MNQNKLVIIGVGHVGSQALTEVLHLQLFAKIALIDSQDKVAEGEALDHRHAAAFHSQANPEIYAGSYEDCQDATVIICAAGPSIVPNTGELMPDRSQLAMQNATVLREIMTRVTEYTKEAVLILITNPLDSMVYLAENEFNYAKGRIFGTGTMLDSARFRQILAENYQVDPKSISGIMMGEHGLTAFPVLSRVSIEGFKADELAFKGSNSLSYKNIQGAVVKTAYDVLNAKGWTNAGIAQATVALVRAVVLNERSIYPVSTTVTNAYGYQGDVAFSLPCIIGKNGIEEQLELPLDKIETEALKHSVAAIKETMKNCGI